MMEVRFKQHQAAGGGLVMTLKPLQSSTRSSRHQVAIQVMHGKLLVGTFPSPQSDLSSRWLGNGRQRRMPQTSTLPGCHVLVGNFQLST